MFLLFKISIPLSQNSHLPYGGFPTKNDHFGVFWGYHHLTPISEMAHQTIKPIFFNSRLARTMRSSLSLLGFLEFMKVKLKTSQRVVFFLRWKDETFVSDQALNICLDPPDVYPYIWEYDFLVSEMYGCWRGLGLSPRLRHIRFMVHVCHPDSETCGVDLISWLFLEKYGGHFPIMDDEKIFKD